MIGNWNEYDKDESSRFFDLSIAYLKACKDVCLRFQSNSSEQSWPNAKVAMMLANHSTELFIKAALLTRDIEASGHNIDALFKKYCEVFSEEDYNFDCPFTTEYLGFTEAGLENARKKKQPSGSVMHRYPIDRPGKEWEGIHGFEIKEFTTLINKLESDFTALRIKLNGS